MITELRDIESSQDDRVGTQRWPAAAPAVEPLQTEADSAEHSPHECERLFVKSLPVIQSVIGAVARRSRLSSDEAEEFGSVVRLRIIDGDYAVLRKFRGGCTLRTFLTVVIQRMFLDYRDAKWGKWRPSARSRRAGNLVMRLERLTMRDGLTFDDACAVLDANQAQPVDRRSLAADYAALRRRSRPRIVTDDQLDLLPAAHGVPDEALMKAENAALLTRATAAIASALAALDPQDRLIVTRRFFEGLPVTAIARELEMDHRPLYPRLARLLRTLRTHLQAHGVRGAEVLEAIAKGDATEIELFHGSKAQRRDVRSVATPQPSRPPQTMAVVA
jgi:RNA polymerase sigma factor for flagellar operon FliA